MGTATIIDGKALAASVRGDVAKDIAKLRETAGITPGLAVVLVGDDPASQVYVRNKSRACEEVGIAASEHRLGADTSETDLLDLIARLNADTAVHGILVQFPVPDHIDAARVIDAIDPAKDVDGLHPVNAGLLAAGRDAMVPCTPQGCLMMLKTQRASLEGLDALVIGRSGLVGKPIAQLLLGENCTVTVAHSRTSDLAAHVGRADILVAAVGRPRFVASEWIKPGAIVIDVGINRIDAPEKGPSGTRLVGDVDFETARETAGAITPVPGGVGPMTVACLMRNTAIAARRQCGR